MSRFTRALLSPKGRTIHGRAVWEVAAPFQFDLGYLGSGRTVTVPAGFATDGPSVPWWMLPFMPVGQMVRSAVLHDFLQTLPGVSPWEADLTFLDALHAEGVPEPARSLAYLAVRWRTARRLKSPNL